MPARTEDLLTIRDGEPIDAARRDRLLADPENRREIERLAHLAEELRQLPVIAPPPGVWARIEADAGRARAARHWRAALAAGAALAISALVAVVLIAPRQAPSPSPPAVANGTWTPAAANGTGTPAAADGTRTPDASPARADYAPLVQESVRLERLLAELQPPPRVVNAGTAFTIANLEEQLVLLDDQLTFAEASDVDPRYRQALWRERVDVMNALVHVRYAQYWERGTE